MAFVVSFVSCAARQLAAKSTRPDRRDGLDSRCPPTTSQRCPQRTTRPFWSPGPPASSASTSRGGYWPTGERCSGSTTSTPITTPASKRRGWPCCGPRAAPISSSRRSTSPTATPPRAVRLGAAAPRPPHGGAGGGPLLDRQAGGLCQQQHRGLPRRAGGLPPRRRRPPRLCLVELGLRRRRHATLRHRGARRPAAQPLCRQQAVERADGARLCPSLPPGGDGPALLHGLRALGQARYGLLPLRAGDRGRPADRALQPGRHDP